MGAMKDIQIKLHNKEVLMHKVDKMLFNHRLLCNSYMRWKIIGDINKDRKYTPSINNIRVELYNRIIKLEEEINEFVVNWNEGGE